MSRPLVTPVLPQGTGPKSMGSGPAVTGAVVPVPVMGIDVTEVPQMAPVVVIGALAERAPAVVGLKRAAAPARVAPDATVCAAGAPVYAMANSGSVAAPTVTPTDALPVFVIVSGMSCACTESCTWPKPALAGDSVSVPPRAVTCRGTVTVAKPGTSVVSVSAPEIVAPAVVVAGTADALRVMLPFCPGATVPCALPTMANGVPVPTLADHVMATGPLFVNA